MYRPGEEGLYWYAVVAGSLEMLDVDPVDSSKVSCKVGMTRQVNDGGISL